MESQGFLPHWTLRTEGTIMPDERLPAGQTGINAALMQVTGSSFRNSYMRSEIEQYQLKGHFEFAEASRLDFGVALTEMKNRTSVGSPQPSRDEAGILFVSVPITATTDKPLDDEYRGFSYRELLSHSSGLRAWLPLPRAA